MDNVRCRIRALSACSFTLASRESIPSEAGIRAQGQTAQVLAHGLGWLVILVAGTIRQHSPSGFWIEMRESQTTPFNHAPPNPGIALRLQSTRSAGRIAGSLDHIHPP
jgi:hypothetical protein